MKTLLAIVTTCVALVAGSCSSSPDAGDAGNSTTSTSSTTSTTVDVAPTDAPTSTSTTTVPPVGPACVDDTWTMVDTGPFTFMIPDGVVDQNAQGIDSLVGRFRGEGIEIAFDYGWFSPGLGDVERLGATIVPISLGGVDGEFGTSGAAGDEYGTDFITHLAVKNIPSADPSTLLWLGVSYDDEAFTETAECIVSTVRFSGVVEPDEGITAESAQPLGEPQGDLAAGEVKLWVSNQSFEDDPVSILVTVDGVDVVEETLFVEGQHNWIAFDIHGLEPGEHTLVAASSTGAEHVATFTLPEDEPRWLVLDYWYYPEDVEGRFFSFNESDQAVAFA